MSISGVNQRAPRPHPKISGGQCPAHMHVAGARRLRQASSEDSRYLWQTRIMQSAACLLDWLSSRARRDCMEPFCHFHREVSQSPLSHLASPSFPRGSGVIVGEPGGARAHLSRDGRPRGPHVQRHHVQCVGSHGAAHGLCPNRLGQRARVRAFWCSFVCPTGPKWGQSLQRFIRVSSLPRYCDFIHGLVITWDFQCFVLSTVFKFQGTTQRHLSFAAVTSPRSSPSLMTTGIWDP